MQDIRNIAVLEICLFLVIGSSLLVFLRLPTFFEGLVQLLFQFFVFSYIHIVGFVLKPIISKKIKFDIFTSNYRKYYDSNVYHSLETKKSFQNIVRACVLPGQ